MLKKIIVGSFHCHRALQIVQNEEYLTAADRDIIKRKKFESPDHPEFSPDDLESDPEYEKIGEVLLIKDQLHLSQQVVLKITTTTIFTTALTYNNNNNIFKPIRVFNSKF